MSLLRDERDVLARLEAWAQAMDACMTRLADGTTISPAQEREIRAQYRAINEAVSAEYKRTSGVRAKMTRAEQDWYKHTVHEAYVDLNVAVNAQPGQQMFDALYAAKADVTHTINGLKRAEKE